MCAKILACALKLFSKLSEGDFLKQKFKAFGTFLKTNFFILFAAFSLILPDFQLRELIMPKIFTEAYAVPATWAFTGLWIFIILFVCLFMLPKKSGRIVYIITSLSFIILSFCQYIYFKIFEQFFWIKSISLLGEGSEYISYAIKYIDLKLIICTSLSVLSLLVAATRWHKPKTSRKVSIWVGIIPIILLSSLHIFMQPEVHGDSKDDWDSWRKPRVVYEQFNDVNKSFEINGLYHFSFRDIFNTVFVPSGYGKKEFQEVTEYFESKEDASKNDYTGIFEGKNVIAVMLEGVDTWMIDPKYTPTMHKMMNEGINFSNYYAPTFGTGHTFNAEFAFNTGYYTPKSAVSAVNFSSNKYPFSLANIFKGKGYTVNSFHFNDSEFYNRGIMHKSFGYEKYHSFTEFGIPKTVAQSDSVILKNDKVYEKMVSEKPFFDFVITYSPHVPYTFDDAKMLVAKGNHPELLDPSMNKEKNNCMILAADTDDFFRQLLDRLEADNLLKDTVIIAFTDHYAYGFSDQELLKEYKNNEIMYRVPAFIYAEGIESIKVEKPMMTIDLLPTILNLFGLTTEGRYIGNDIFDPKNEGFVYFGNLAWLDKERYYVPYEDEPTDIDKEYIKMQNQRVSESLKINDIVISGDYYKNH